MPSNTEKREYPSALALVTPELLRYSDSAMISRRLTDGSTTTTGYTSAIGLHSLVNSSPLLSKATEAKTANQA